MCLGSGVYGTVLAPPGALLIMLDSKLDKTISRVCDPWKEQLKDKEHL